MVMVMVVVEMVVECMVIVGSDDDGNGGDDDGNGGDGCSDDGNGDDDGSDDDGNGDDGCSDDDGDYGGCGGNEGSRGSGVILVVISMVMTPFSNLLFRPSLSFSRVPVFPTVIQLSFTAHVANRPTAWRPTSGHVYRKTQ